MAPTSRSRQWPRSSRGAAPAAERVLLSTPACSSPNGLTLQRQDEIEDRPQHVLTGTRRTGGARSGDDSRRRVLQAVLPKGAAGSHKPASATMDRAEAAYRTSLIS